MEKRKFLFKALSTFLITFIIVISNVIPTKALNSTISKTSGSVFMLSEGGQLIPVAVAFTNRTAVNWSCNPAPRNDTIYSIFVAGEVLKSQLYDFSIVVKDIKVSYDGSSIYYTDSPNPTSGPVISPSNCQVGSASCNPNVNFAKHGNVNVASNVFGYDYSNGWSISCFASGGLSN